MSVGTTRLIDEMFASVMGECVFLKWQVTHQYLSWYVMLQPGEGVADFDFQVCIEGRQFYLVKSITSVWKQFICNRIKKDEVFFYFLPKREDTEEKRRGTGLKVV
jgi:hypothetical protein